MEEGMSPSHSSISLDDQETPDSDEFFMQQNLLFSDSLKGLKKMRSQLYSAAEYFEVSYESDDQQIVMNTLRDYTVKALVNAIDHLGSVSNKVNGFISQEVDEVTDAELQVCCIEQRIRTCQEFIDVEGRSQQAIVIKAPRYHKHYMNEGETVPELGAQLPSYKEYVPCKDDSRPKQFPNAKVLPKRGWPSTARILYSAAPSRSISPSLQRARSLSPSHKTQSSLPPPRPGSISLEEKRAISPLRTSKSLSRAGSPISSVSKPLCRPELLNSHTSKPLTSMGSPPFRPTIPNPSKKFLPHRQNSATSLDGKAYNQMPSDQNPTKSRGFLKSLLTRRRSRNDELLYSYLDEY